MNRLLLTACLLGAGAAHGQFAPQATVSGSTAIQKSDSRFISWASECSVRPGLQLIGNPSLGYVNAGDSSAVLGAPDGFTVSLGDSGVAVVRFAQPVTNGPGPDFAVFENGFADGADPEMAFLELAFVEVSSDGIHYTRFPATSNTQDTFQHSSIVGSMFMNARGINNLAGKYIANWGTPFDLDELAGAPGLDVNNITHVRIVDVIGAIGEVGSRDANGRKINDPFPTAFPTGGFDLDAVGVIHAAPTSVPASVGMEGIALYPNPAGEMLHLCLPEGIGYGIIVLYDAAGRALRQEVAHEGVTMLTLDGLAPGSYFITIRSANGATCTRAFSHR